MTSQHGKPGYNCRHCDHGPKTGKRLKQYRTYKKIDPQELIDDLLPYFRTLPEHHRVMKEELSVRFCVEESIVAQALQKMNLMGYVAQPTHSAPHDSTRDRWAGGINVVGDSPWMGDQYKLTSKVHKE
jgi:hypothetical protein